MGDAPAADSPDGAPPPAKRQAVAGADGAPAPAAHLGPAAAAAAAPWAASGAAEEQEEQRGLHAVPDDELDDVGIPKGWRECPSMGQPVDRFIPM